MKKDVAINLRKLILGCRRSLRSSRALQVGAVLGFWLVGEGLARWSGLPVPGGIIGMVMVLILLASGRLSQASLRQGANWFIAEMLLFFVPAVLAVLDHREFLGLLGLKVLSVILVGTVVVMSVTALVVELSFRLMARSEVGRHGLE
jgi:holin-like protein